MVVNGRNTPDGVDLDTSRTPSPISPTKGLSGSDPGSDRDWIAKVIPMTDQIRRLQTIIRDQESSRSDFVFSADRLIRLVVEEGLNLLPYKVIDYNQD